MSYAAYFRKPFLAARLARGAKITLGERTYRIKGFIVNTLALSGARKHAESSMDEVYAAALKCKPGAFLDVGVNLGQTLFKILALDPRRLYFGFEPQLSCAFFVQQFLQQNQLGSQCIFPFGLSNESRMVRLFHREGNFDRSASIVQGFRPDSFYSGQDYVSVRRGDEVVSELQVGPISTIKIDAEGAELEVVEGLLGTIQRDLPFVIFEVLNHVLATGEALNEETIAFRESRVRRMEALLRQQGYDIYNIVSAGIVTKVAQIEPRRAQTPLYTNYIAASQSHSSLFEQCLRESAHL